MGCLCQRLAAGERCGSGTVQAAGQTLPGTVPATAGDREFRRVHVGEIELPAGKTALTLRPKELNYGYVFATVRRVVLTPT